METAFGHAVEFAADTILSETNILLRSSRDRPLLFTTSRASGRTEATPKMPANNNTISPVIWEALVECLLFLETANEVVLDPDAAVFQLESVASILHRLTEDEKRQFRNFLQRRADRLSSDRADDEHARVLRELANDLGL